MKSTLVFNVLQKSACMQFSHCRQNWCYGLQAMYSSMALKSGGGSAHILTPHWQKVRGSGPKDPHRIAAIATVASRWRHLTADTHCSILAILWLLFAVNMVLLMMILLQRLVKSTFLTTRGRLLPPDWRWPRPLLPGNVPTARTAQTILLVPTTFTPRDNIILSLTFHFSSSPFPFSSASHPLRAAKPLAKHHTNCYTIMLREKENHIRNNYSCLILNITVHSRHDTEGTRWRELLKFTKSCHTL